MVITQAWNQTADETVVSLERTLALQSPCSPPQCSGPISAVHVSFLCPTLPFQLLFILRCARNRVSNLESMGRSAQSARKAAVTASSQFTLMSHRCSKLEPRS